MTVYSGIPNNDIDPESPIVTGLFTSLRDNPIAISEGAIGAPRIQSAAIESSSIFSTHIATLPINNLAFYESPKYAPVSTSSYVLTHNLGGQPEIVQVYYECVSTQVSGQGGYFLGNTIVMPVGADINSGFSIVPSSTTISVRTGSSPHVLPDKSVGTVASYTDNFASSDFVWFLRAYR